MIDITSERQGSLGGYAALLSANLGIVYACGHRCPRGQNADPVCDLMRFYVIFEIMGVTKGLEIIS